MNEKTNNNDKEKKTASAAMVSVGSKGVEIRSLEELLNFAQLAVKHEAAPKGMSYGAAALCIQAGLERGLGLMAGLQQVVPINGVLSWRGQGAIALIQNSSLCKPGSFMSGTEGEGENMYGWAEAHRVGYEKPSRREFTYKHARRAGLIGKRGPWTDYPERQFMWRAVGFLARDVFPDVLGGFPLAEEAVDFEPIPEQDKPPPITARVEDAPKPSAPDPLLQNLEIPQAKPEPQAKAEPVEAEVVTDPDREDPNDNPPFESHEEADAQLAKEQSLFE